GWLRVALHSLPTRRSSELVDQHLGQAEVLEPLARDRREPGDHCRAQRDALETEDVAVLQAETARRIDEFFRRNRLRNERDDHVRSEEHTSELQSREISYAV